MISKKNLTSLIFFFVFAFSFPLYSTIDVENHFYFTIILLFLCVFLLLLNVKLIFRSLKINKSVNLFLFVFFMLSLLTFIIKNDTNTFILFSPFFTFVAIAIVTQLKLNINILIIGILAFYIYYYNIYFSTLPSFFDRKEIYGFDEELNFSGASSNIIPIVLNNLIYIFLILNSYYKLNKNKIILIFSTINIPLIFIQNSRAGLIVAVLLFLINLFEFYPKVFKKYSKIIYILIAYISVLTLQLGIEKFDSNTYELTEIANQGRAIAQVMFFSEMTINEFFWGYPEDHSFFLFDYTYNVFLDVWNKIGFIGFLLLVIIFFRRLINNKKYHFPLIYFTPFLVYSLVESIYFPKYWDFAIILLLIIPVNYRLNKWHSI